ncbi:MAG TPA: POTRA domain-containing protein [Bacteroidia bacterium]|nr:POTRA domain-containing protein [Bacteroidia bacterium]
MRLPVPVIVFVLLRGMLSAQTTFSLDVIEPGNEHALKKIDYAKTFRSKAERTKTMNDILVTLWNESYIAARYDSVREDSSSATAYLDPGVKYKWARIGKGNVDEQILSATGFREKTFRNRAIRFKDVAKVEENILEWCENHGYPFASVQLDSVRFDNENTISAQLSLNKNRYTKIDSIDVDGSLKISRPFLYNYIGIRPGDAYDESKLVALSKRLRELAFAKVTKSYTILFTEKYTKLTLYLDKKRAGQFDGVVGFLPDSRTGKIQFSGDARLKLQNSFGHGEVLELTWSRLRVQTQDLKVHVNYPYLLHTPVGIDYTIKLYRQDTTFIDVNQAIGLQYMFSANTSLTAFVKRRSSTLLSTSLYEASTVLPDFADISTNAYGLGFHREDLDYRFNPRRGYAFTITADIGNRNIKENPRLNPVVYQNLTLHSVQYGSELDAEKFFPVGKRSTIMTGLKSAWLYNSQSIFRNELYRIGGLKTLRGFDEESIYASSYAIGTVEYRFLLEENSWWFVFTDACWYENNSRNTFVTDTPFGFGTGITFETKAGIFALTYALGSQFGNPVQFKDGKIHVGFVGMF